MAWDSLLNIKGPKGDSAEGSPAVKIRADYTAQGLPNQAATQLDFNVVDFNDNTALFTPNLDSNTITVNQSGLYLVSMSVRISANTGGGERSVGVTINGVLRSEFNLAVGAGIPCVLPTSTLVRLSAGDVLGVELWISGGDANIESADPRFTWLAVASVGGTAVDALVTSHHHDDRYFTEAEVNAALAGKVDTTDARLTDARPPLSHDHNGLYYTETEVDTLLAGKQAAGSYAPASHSHNDLYYTETEVNNLLAGKVNTNDSRLTDARTPTAHTHDDRYYTETETNTLLAGKANSTHGHAISDVTGLQSALDAKQAAGSYAAATHAHAAEDITSGTLSAQRIPKVLSPINTSTEAGPNVQLTNTSWNYKSITATGNLQFLAPTTFDERQILQVAVLASGGARTITFAPAIEVLTGMTRSYNVPSGELLRFSLEYSALINAWVLTACGVTGG